MLWDVDLYTLFAIAILVFVASSILAMGGVMVRRMMSQRSDHQVLLECNWYRPTIASVLEGRFWGDPDQLRKKPNSAEWKAIEKLLLKGSESLIEEQRQRAIRMFEQLGYVEFYIHQLKAEKPWKRFQAGLRLGQMRSPGAVSFLVQALDDDSGDVRQAAVQALGMIRDPKAISALVEQIPKYRMAPSHQKISWRVLKESLVAQGEPAVSMLVRRLLDPHDAVRILVADILSEIPSQGALEHLIRCLDDSHPEVKARAARALGRIGHPIAVKSLLKLLLDPFWYVRLQATKALGSFTSPRAISGLCARLEDSHWQVRMAAAHALIAIGPVALPALTTYLLYTRDHYACEQMIEVFQQAGFVDQWIEELASSDTQTAHHAKKILSAIARTWLLESLTSAARNHPRLEVRIGLVGMLGGVDNPKSSKTLRQISLYDSDSKVRELARDLLTNRLRYRMVLKYAGNFADRPSGV
jgi:HEAT repeat protein